MIKFTNCYINVSDFEKAVKFYTELFGECPTYLEPNSWASWFEGRFCLNNDDSEIKHGDNTIPGFSVSSEIELESLYQSLRVSGKKVSPPMIVPNTPGYYYKYIWVTDDWGNNLEIAFSTNKLQDVDAAS